MGKTDMPDDLSLYTQPQVIERIIQAGKRRVDMPVLHYILLGIMAGAFISFGAAASSVAAHNISNYGLSRVVTGFVFPVGLMMIVLVGGELFTGDCLMVMGVWDKKYSAVSMLKTLIIILLSNLAGSLLFAFLIYYSGIFSYSDGALGAYMIKIAYGKCTILPVKAFCSGILCNILVCCAVLIANSAKDVIGRIAGVFFPIMAFVVGGWEHSIANMFYIPAGMFAALNKDYLNKAQSLYSIGEKQIESSVSVTGFISNIVPVVLGNTAGAMLFLALPLYIVNRRNRG